MMQEFDKEVKKVELFASFDYEVERIKKNMYRNGCIYEDKNATIRGFIQYSIYTN